MYYYFFICYYFKVNYLLLSNGINYMSYNEKQDYQEHVNTWKNFIRLGTYCTIGILALVVLMAIFLV